MCHVIRTYPQKLPAFWTHFGHQNELAAETVIGIGIVVIYRGDGYIRLVAQIADGRDFRLCLQAGHESASNSGDDVYVINQCNEISLCRSDGTHQ